MLIKLDLKANARDYKLKLKNLPLKFKSKMRRSLLMRKMLLMKLPRKTMKSKKREPRTPYLLKRKLTLTTMKSRRAKPKRNWISLKKKNNFFNNNKNLSKSNKRLLIRLISPSRNNKNLLIS
jgi:hypothetical protein